MIVGVVASMDRAFQCDALLRSLQYVAGLDRIVVIARATSALHMRAYARLKMRFGYIEVIDDTDGYSVHLGRVVQQLADTDHLMLMVDDQMFFAHADCTQAAAKLSQVQNAFVWTWRLGFDSRFCESLGDGTWKALAAVKDDYYGYPWHSDGALFNVGAWRAHVDRALSDWATYPYIPNELEAAGAKAIRESFPHFAQLGGERPVCTTWQINKEATTRHRFGAKWCGISEIELDELARKYVAGARFSLSPFWRDAAYRFFNSPHVPPTLEMARRFASYIEF